MKSNIYGDNLHYHRDDPEGKPSALNSNTVRGTYLAPTQSRLQKWLREVHNIHCTTWCNASGWAWELEKTNGTHISIMNINGQVDGTEPESGMFDTFEKALEAGLYQALLLI